VRRAPILFAQVERLVSELGSSQPRVRAEAACELGRLGFRAEAAEASVTSTGFYVLFF